MRWYRAVAMDLDGTLTAGGPPSALLLDRIDQLREDGVRMILVTGRILAELGAEMPGLTDHFDLVVAENGSVLRAPAWTRRLADPVDPRLLTRLRSQQVPARRGEVIVATDASADHLALDAIDALQLEIQLIRNRAALMLVPAGVSKGTGLAAALHELAVSRHNTIAIGDAENDHSMLAVAELGVSVADGVESLRRSADLVLSQPDGAGVLELLDGDVLAGRSRAISTHRRVVLGSGPDGSPATLPAAQTNVLITGASESGKSYLAGLMIEQLLALDYTALIIDPEGDHVVLGGLRGVMVLPGSELPDPRTVLELYAQGIPAVVLDLSCLQPAERECYLARLWPAVLDSREESAIPHWILVEEAQNIGLCRQHLLDRTDGVCLVTYRPELLPPSLLASMEWRITTGSSGQELPQLRSPDEMVRPFRMARRWTRHVRHWHKYTDSQLPSQLRFRFTTRGRPVHAPAGTLREFVTALEEIPPEVVAGHARRGDFSRWLGEQYRDHVAASLVATVERDLVAHGDAERARTQIAGIVRLRYLADLPVIDSGSQHSGVGLRS